MNGIIATDVAALDRPWMIWIYSGTVKLMAASVPTMMNSVITATHSLAESTTSSASGGVRPALAVRCDQAKKPMTMAAPIMIIAGAGETPRILKGALAPAKNAPQFLRLLKPNVIKMMPTAASTTPSPSIFTSGLAAEGLSLKLNSRMAAAWMISNTKARRQLIWA